MFAHDVYAKFRFKTRLPSKSKKVTCHLALTLLVWKEKIREIPKEKRVYVDEAGFDSYLYRRHARAPRGEKVKGRKYQRTSIVAGKMGANIIAPLEYTGTMHGDFFEAWFEEHLGTVK